ncbi:MAG: hypothetical protein JEY96_01605 [Bacteroidales bacterium]|nr:hypothetical protein [Bacteroidales bacterium]
MTKKEYYETVRNRDEAKLLDKILIYKTDIDLYDQDIMDRYYISEANFNDSIIKILQYHKNIQEIVIPTESKEQLSFLTSNRTEPFIRSGGFTKEYDYFDEAKTLDGKIKRRKATMLQWQIWIFWPLFGISIISLLISFYTLFFK